MTGQISLIDYIHDRDDVTFGGCGQSSGVPVAV